MFFLKKSRDRRFAFHFIRPNGVHTKEAKEEKKNKKRETVFLVPKFSYTNNSIPFSASIISHNILYI